MDMAFFFLLSFDKLKHAQPAAFANHYIAAALRTSHVHARARVRVLCAKYVWKMESLKQLLPVYTMCILDTHA